MPEEACPVDLPEQGVQPMITVITSDPNTERVDEQHATGREQQ